MGNWVHGGGNRQGHARDVSQGNACPVFSNALVRQRMSYAPARQTMVRGTWHGLWFFFFFGKMPSF